MKRFLALFLALFMVFSLVSCTKKQEKEIPLKQEPPKAGEYVLSEDVIEGSVINGVMTDIQVSDPILQKTVASWLDTCVLYEVNVRQYTQEGTFKAFEGHLNRLKDMGINTLWFMPIHPISETERKGTLGSYYAVDDYMKVNPEFGTMEDFKHLVDTAHEMGFKVILDWVANHTGWDNPWITEHNEWYQRDENGNITYSYDWSDIAELDYSNYEMRAEMIKCMQFWVEEVKVDGFRCDHAIGVPASFWNAAVYKLKSINKEILMLAEVSPAPGLTQYAFDSCYNDPLYGSALSVEAGLGAMSLDQGLAISPNFVEGSFPMNYLDNHDKNSYEGSIVDRFGDTYEPLLATSFIAPGFPLIYTGNEQGYDHEIEFFEKDAVVWDSNPKYAPMIAALSQLKKGNRALASTNRNLEYLQTSNGHVLALSRAASSDKVIFVSNLFYESLSDVTIDIGVENATCVMHYDGTTFDTQEKEVTKKDFENKDFNPYEFYVLTVYSK